MKNHRILLLAISSGLALGWASVATAQDAPALQSGQAGSATPTPASPPAAEEQADGSVGSADIGGTARKRTERALDIPAAISAIGGSTLGDRGAPSLHDLDRIVPSVTITNFGAGNISQAAVFIRGIGTGDHRITTDPGVGIYIDGVYISRNQGINFNLTNLDHVEILRGPQGTLAGRNTIGGAINLVTKQPGSTEYFEFGLQAGTRGRANFDFYGSTPVTDTLAVSLSGSLEHRNGIGDFINLPGTDTRVGQILQGSGRFTAKWTPNDRATLVLSAEGFKGAYGVTPQRMIIINPAGFSGLRDTDLPANPNDNGTTNPNIPNTSATVFGVSAVGTYELSDNLSTKLILAERYNRYKGGLDDDNSPKPISEFPEVGSSRQYSAEGQLNGEFDNFNFVAGLFYFREKGRSRVFLGVNGGNPIMTGLDQTVDSYAGYIHAGYDLTDSLKISGGARYTEDEKTASFFRQPGAAINRVSGGSSKSWSKVTWDVALNYKFSPELVAYATVQRGYQSGGFPPRASSVAAFAPYNPTTATNFEAGLKGDIGRVFSFSTAVFYTKYNDLVLQYTQNLGGTTGTISFLANAGRSRTYGAEFEGSLNVGGGFSFDGSVGFNDAKVTEVTPGTVGTAVGNRPQNTPKWTASFGPQYRSKFDNGDVLTVRVDGSYRSSFFSQPLNNAYNRVDSRVLANFDISYEIADKNLRIGLYGNNIFNEVYDVTRLDNFNAGYIEVLSSNDRSEFGVRLRKKF